MGAAGFDMHPTCSTLESTPSEHPTVQTIGPSCLLTLSQSLHDLQSTLGGTFLEFDDRVHLGDFVMHIVTLVLDERSNTLRSCFIDLVVPLISISQLTEHFPRCLLLCSLLGTLLSRLKLHPCSLITTITFEHLCRDMEGTQPPPLCFIQVAPQVSHQDTLSTLLKSLPPCPVGYVDLLAPKDGLECKPASKHPRP